MGDPAVDLLDHPLAQAVVCIPGHKVGIVHPHQPVVGIVSVIASARAGGVAVFTSQVIKDQLSFLLSFFNFIIANQILALSFFKLVLTIRPTTYDSYYQSILNPDL